MFNNVLSPTFLILICLASASVATPIDTSADPNPIDTSEVKIVKKRDLVNRIVNVIKPFFSADFQFFVTSIQNARDLLKAFDTTEEPFYDYEDGSLLIKSSFLMIVLLTMLSVFLNMF